MLYVAELCLHNDIFYWYPPCLIARYSELDGQNLSLQVYARNLAKDELHEVHSYLRAVGLMKLLVITGATVLVCDLSPAPPPTLRIVWRRAPHVPENDSWRLDSENEGI